MTALSHLNSSLGMSNIEVYQIAINHTKCEPWQHSWNILYIWFAFYDLAFVLDMPHLNFQQNIFVDTQIYKHDAQQ